MGSFIRGSKDKTIYIFNSHLMPSRTGGEMYDYEVGRYLASAGYNVRFVEAIDLFRFRGKGFTEPFFLIFNLGNIMNKSVMIFDGVSHKRMNLFCIYLRLFTNARLFTIVHHPTNLFVENEINRRIDRFSEWLFFHLMHKIVVVSNFAKNHVLALGVKKRIKVIHPAANIAKKHKRKKFSDGSINILFVGYLEKWKGFDILIRALGTIYTKEIDWKLTVVGNSNFLYSYAKNCLDLINEFNISDRVNFLGRVDKDGMEEVYKSADIFVLPSLHESRSMAIREAASYGLPIISTNVGGTSELVESGKSAILVEPGDVEGLRDALVKLMKDKDLRKRLGDSALKTVDFDYNWDSVGEMFEEYMNESFYIKQ